LTHVLLASPVIPLIPLNELSNQHAVRLRGLTGHCSALNPSDGIRLMRFWDCCVTAAKLTRQKAKLTVVVLNKVVPFRAEAHLLKALKCFAFIRSDLTSPNGAFAIIG